MGVMDKILNVMRLEPEDEYEYDNENYEDDLIAEKSSIFSKKDRDKEDDYDEFSLDRDINAAINIKQWGIEEIKKQEKDQLSQLQRLRQCGLLRNRQVQEWKFV